MLICSERASFLLNCSITNLGKGPFKYYVIKEVGGWDGMAKWWCLMTRWVGGAGYMMMWSKKYKEMPIISIKTYLKYIYPFKDITDQFNSSDYFFL